MTTITLKLRINPYRMLEEAVEVGVRRGYYRAYKHNDKPTEEEIIEAIKSAVMGDLCEVIDFDSLYEKEGV